MTNIKIILGVFVYLHVISPFLARLYKSTESYYHFYVGVGVGITHFKVILMYVKVFYIMGKAVSGELSCMRTGLVSKRNNYDFLFPSLDYME